jgi:hypothetical protein
MSNSNDSSSSSSISFYVIPKVPNLKFLDPFQYEGIFRRRNAKAHKTYHNVGKTSMPQGELLATTGQLKYSLV